MASIPLLPLLGQRAGKPGTTVAESNQPFLYSSFSRIFTADPAPRLEREVNPLFEASRYNLSRDKGPETHCDNLPRLHCVFSRFWIFTAGAVRELGVSEAQGRQNLVKNAGNGIVRHCRNRRA